MKAKILFAGLLLMTSTGVLFAQSGRKSNGSSSSTTTTTPSVTGPKIVEKKPADAPRVQLWVGIDKQDNFSSVPNNLFDTVLDIVIQRLGEAEIVFANSAGEMNRGKAVKTAKEEKTRWVILLEIRSLSQDLGQQPKNLDELSIEFTAFEPESGKAKRSGHTSQHGRGGISLPSKNGPMLSDYAIKQAAIETADKILAGFDITVRQGTPF